MKHLLSFSLLLTTSLFASLLLADQEILDIRPAASPANASSATNWEWSKGKILAAQTTDEVLAGFVKDEATAKKLLASVRGAYVTDPLTAHQIAAVSQWVMVSDDVAWYDFWSDTPRADGRKVWVKALADTAESATDSYVKTFCLDQLRWCGCDCPCLIARIREIGVKSGDKAVQDFSEVVIRELEGKGVGL